MAACMLLLSCLNISVLRLMELSQEQCVRGNVRPVQLPRFRVLGLTLADGVEVSVQGVLIPLLGIRYLLPRVGYIALPTLISWCHCESQHPHHAGQRLGAPSHQENPTRLTCVSLKGLCRVRFQRTKGLGVGGVHGG